MGTRCFPNSLSNNQLAPFATINKSRLTACPAVPLVMLPNSRDGRPRLAAVAAALSLQS